MRTLRSHNKTLTWMVSPIVAFGIIWVMQVLAHFTLPINFMPIESKTWLIVLIGYVSLLMGAAVLIIINQTGRRDEFIKNNLAKKSTKFDVRLLYGSLICSIMSSLFLIATVEKNEIGFLHSIKESLLAESATGNKALTYIIYIFIFQVLLTIYYFNSNGFKKDVKTSVFFVSAILGSLMSGSRGLLIFFLIALIPCIISKKHEINFNAKILGLILMFIVIFFFLYPFIFQEMSINDEGDWIKLFGYIFVYLFSGISAFDDVVKTNMPIYDCFLMVPRPLLIVFDVSLQTNMLSSCPAIYEEKYLPLPTNVYTIFFAPYHDIGVIGVVFYLFVIGFVSQLFFIKGCLQNNDTWRFFYCIFFYTIMLSFFEDQFSRGIIYYIFGLAAFFSNVLIKKR
jgi:oligosaccharide repeat unit polymerase